MKFLRKKIISNLKGFSFGFKGDLFSLFVKKDCENARVKLMVILRAKTVRFELRDLVLILGWDT